LVNQGISLYAVGDVHPDRPNPDEIFDKVRPILKEADIMFGHCEGVISKKSVIQPSLPSTLSLMDPGCGLAFRNAGFNVMGCAGNHSMAYIDFLDTLDILKMNGIIAFGMGKDIDEARKPAILDIRGTRVGFLTRNCINNLLPFELRAGVGKPGTAGFRVYSSYQLVDTQPGMPPTVHTTPDEQDLEDLIDDVKKLRSQVDVVVWSPHWGLHHVPKELAEYETKVAHMVIDAGADLIVGHHAHLLKGIEIYKGKAIIYCVGNFAFDIYGVAPRNLIEKYGPYNMPQDILAIRSAKFAKERPSKPGIGPHKFDPEYPTSQWPPPVRNTMIVKCLIVKKQIQKVTLVLARVNKRGQPEPCSPKTLIGREVLKMLEEGSEYFNTKLPVKGDEVVVI
jgi:poly-gamma-glutamate capsule biosynthesis protein CapA/YwtB (metallophosphatase superfamily)